MRGVWCQQRKKKKESSYICLFLFSANLSMWRLDCLAHAHTDTHTRGDDDETQVHFKKLKRKISLDSLNRLGGLVVLRVCLLGSSCVSCLFWNFGCVYFPLVPLRFLPSGVCDCFSSLMCFSCVQLSPPSPLLVCWSPAFLSSCTRLFLVSFMLLFVNWFLSFAFFLIYTSAW